VLLVQIFVFKIDVFFYVYDALSTIVCVCVRALCVCAVPTKARRQIL
jgi:hypothetical protein